MMAASVVRTGITGTGIESSPGIPSSQHSTSMHDPSSVSPNSSRPSATAKEVVNNNSSSNSGDLVGKSRTNDPLSSISAGKKLALSSTQGPAASLVNSNTSRLHEDEKDIALSQLKELEVAIEVRKVTRVDGRKTRWIEYRREKKENPKKKLKSKKPQTSANSNINNNSNNNNNKINTNTIQKKSTLKVLKTIKKIKKFTERKFQKDDLEKSISSVEKLADSPEVTNNNNNNNNNNIENNNNSSVVDSKMKVEVGGPVIGSLGTNNVLESMKQQFLQGTVHVPETTNNLKDKPVRKSVKTANGSATSNHVSEKFKRKPGRPKKGDKNTSNTNSSSKASLAFNNVVIKTENSQVGPVPQSSVIGAGESNAPKKVELSQSTADFYSRRNFLTKGLREVRKSESGSESGGSSPVKDGSPSTLSPSPQLALCPIPPLKSVASESGNPSTTSLKCPLINAPVKALSTAVNAKKPKLTYGLASKKKKIMKKMSKKENINFINKPNGHDKVANGSTKKKTEELNGKTLFKKRGRGRPKVHAANEEPIKWMKKTSTVIVDVHNTMNGEPQTVIPVQNPIVLRKKKLSSPKSLKLPIGDSTDIDKSFNPDSKDKLIDSPKISSNKQKDLSSVPEAVSNAPSLQRSASPTKKSANSQSASNNFSEISDSGKFHSTKSKLDASDTEKEKDAKVPEISPHTSSPSPVISLNKNEDSDISINEKQVPLKVSKTKEVKFSGLRKSGANSITNNSTTTESFRKQNSDTKKQTSIDSYLKPKPNNFIEKESQSSELEITEDSNQIKHEIISPERNDKYSSLIKEEDVEVKEMSIDVIPDVYDISNNIDIHPCNTSDSKVTTNSDDPKVSVNCESHLSDTENLHLPQNVDLECKSNIKSEPKVSNKNHSVSSNKSSLPNGSNKLYKKTPEKVKNKSLNAVIQKLYSPPPKQLSNSITSTVNEVKVLSSLAQEVSSTKSDTENSDISNSSSSINRDNQKYRENIDVKESKQSNIEEKTKEQISIVQPIKKKAKTQSSINNNPGDTKVTVNPSATTKPKEKVPRFLKQLFQDEGVQNMLRSVNEEAVPNVDGTSNLESGPHKLRPKRANENFISDSPEPDDSLFIQGSKRKRRGTEVDNLFLDEGTLNLLTSIDANSRRSSVVDDNASDSSQSSSSKSSNLMTNKPPKSLSEAGSSQESQKRKLNPSVGVIVGKVLHNEAKRPKLESDVPQAEASPLPQQFVASEPVPATSISNLEKHQLDLEMGAKKKPGRPSLPAAMKQKTKAQVMFQLRKQLHKYGISSDKLNIAQMKELLAKAKRNEYTSKQVPPPPPSQIQAKAVEQLNQQQPNETDQSILSSVNSVNKNNFNNNNTNTNNNNNNNEGAQPPSRVSKPSTATSVTANNHTQNYNRHPINDSNPVSAASSTTTTTTTTVNSVPIVKKTKPTTASDRPPFKFSSSVTSNTTNRKVSYSVGSSPLQLTSLVRPVETPSSYVSQRGRPRLPGEGVRQSQRTSVRQSEGNYHYRDISLRKFNNFMQIILTPSTTKMKNALNSRVLRELCEALSTLRRDDSIRMVLLTATGSTFCQGIDLTSLQHPNHETRKKNAENLARGIKDFLRALVQFPKIIVAGVNGNAMGLGVTMLPLFDMVYATDKAEFFLPYTKLGQVPEGGATFTFPNYYGKLQSNKLFLGQKITASQAEKIGLITEAIWPATFQESLLPKVASLATQSPISMEGTKALVNHHILTKLELSVESECRILLQQWTSPNFSNMCKRFLESTEVQLQKPVNLPL